LTDLDSFGELGLWARLISNSRKKLSWKWWNIIRKLINRLMQVERPPTIFFFSFREIKEKGSTRPRHAPTKHSFVFTSQKSFSWFTFQNHYWRGNDYKSSPTTFKKKIIMTIFWVDVFNYLLHIRIIIKFLFLFNGVFFTLLIVDQFLHH
jgi:hypothetical protein